VRQVGNQPRLLNYALTRYL